MYDPIFDWGQIKTIKDAYSLAFLWRFPNITLLFENDHVPMSYFAPPPSGSPLPHSRDKAGRAYRSTLLIRDYNDVDNNGLIINLHVCMSQLNEIYLTTHIHKMNLNYRLHVATSNGDERNLTKDK